MYSPTSEMIDCTRASVDPVSIGVYLEFSDGLVSRPAEVHQASVASVRLLVSPARTNDTTNERVYKKIERDTQTD